MEAVQNDRKLINTIVYLASLVSDPKVIDPQLDTLRTITAELKPNAPLSDNQRQELVNVSFVLTDHLLHHDKIRSFTPQTLDLALKHHVDAPIKRQSLRAVGAIGLIVAGTYAAGLIVFAPFSFERGMLVSPMLAFVAMYLGIAWLFWSGLHTFTPSLKRAYGWICAGYIATGLAVCVSPLPVAYPELSDGVLLRFGVITPSIVIANVLIWMGMQVFAQALNIRSWMATPWTMLLGIGLIGVIAFIVPHPTQQPSEFWFDLSLASAGAAGLFASGSAWLAFKISRQTSALYARAMGWFSVTMGLIAFNMLALVTPIIYLMGKTAGAAFYTAVFAFSIAGVLMVVSAYKFKRSSGSS